MSVTVAAAESVNDSEIQMYISKEVSLLFATKIWLHSYERYIDEYDRRIIRVRS